MWVSQKCDGVQAPASTLPSRGAFQPPTPAKVRSLSGLGLGECLACGERGEGVLFTSEGPCWAQETGCRGFGPQAHMVRVGTLWLACLKAAATSRVEGADCQCCDRTLRMDVEPVH